MEEAVPDSPGCSFIQSCSESLGKEEGRSTQKKDCNRRREQCTPYMLLGPSL